MAPIVFYAVALLAAVTCGILRHKWLTGSAAPLSTEPQELEGAAMPPESAFEAQPMGATETALAKP